MRKKSKLAAIAVTFLTAASLFAGGFALEIGKPSANPEAQAKNAVLMVRGYACHNAEETTVTATAEGVVNGKRETIPLKLIPLSAQSTYALTRQWPADGKWVISLVEANPHFRGQPSALVKIDGDAVDFAGVTRLTRAPSQRDVEAALNAPLAHARGSVHG